MARIGMQVERSTSVANRQILSVVAGVDQFSTLTPEERTVAHATVDARMAARVASQRFGREVRRAGQATVSIDDDGQLVEIAPAGDRRSREPPRRDRRAERSGEVHVLPAGHRSGSSGCGPR